jgi:hypothetical protein
VTSGERPASAGWYSGRRGGAEVVALLTHPLQAVAGHWLVRRAADAALARWSRRRVAALDHLDVAETQRRTLRRLAARAAATRFGRDHDLAGVRTPADFRERVPLRTYEQFWNDYWSAAFPRLGGVTWPGPIPYHALSSGTTSGTTKYVPVSPDMLASNRRAALTSLALFRNHDPNAALFTGRTFFLGGSTALARQADGSLAGDLSGIAAVELSPALRPYTFPPPDLALLTDWDEKVDRLAHAAVRLPVTAVTGVPAWLLVLFDRVKRAAGKATVAEVWPMLRLVVHGGTRFDPYRELFRREVGSHRVAFQETYPCSEGFVAAEDPRWPGLLRVLPDHGLFFEFVPLAELDAARPTRHTLAEVEPGVPYAVVLTTCAGLWAYVVGDTVAFERRDPPLLRFTGRTKYFLSAFGEHLISEEVERAVAAAAAACGAAVVDFHVGPVFPTTPDRPGRHRFFVEFAPGSAPADAAAFALGLDRELSRLNDDYRAHRAGDLSLAAPEVVAVPAGGFAAWMKSRGRYGGQNKVPRMDNSGEVTARLGAWLAGG